MKYEEGEIRTLSKGEQKALIGKIVYIRSSSNDRIIKRILYKVDGDLVKWCIPEDCLDGTPLEPFYSNNSVCRRWQFFPNYWMAYKYMLKLRKVENGQSSNME